MTLIFLFIFAYNIIGDDMKRLIILLIILILSGCQPQETNLIKTTVTRVVDGDTIYVKGYEKSVRLIGVDTPESVHPDKRKNTAEGKKASNYTKEQLTNKTIWLEFDVRQTDKYGRLLAYVWLEPPKAEDECRSKMYNAKLLLDGYAKTMTIQPNVKYQEMFIQFQREAMENKKGLWKS